MHHPGLRPPLLREEGSFFTKNFLRIKKDSSTKRKSGNESQLPSLAGRGRLRKAETGRVFFVPTLLKEP
jgi:hypothetical protein